MARTYPYYRFAYMAWHGRIGEDVREVWIGEIESPKHAHQEIAAKIRAQQHKVAGTYPREIRIGRGQFAGEYISQGHPKFLA